MGLQADAAGSTSPAVRLAVRALEHSPGGKRHNERDHGRWAATRRAAKAAAELGELRQSITAAQRRVAEIERARQPQLAAGGSKATPSRMTKGEYTKQLKGEHIRLLMLDGKTEREAKRLARPEASIDELKDRNKTLRRALKAKGIDYRTDEQRDADDAEKNGLLDEVEELARAGGHDPEAKRAGASRMSVPELRKFVQDVKDFQKRQNAKRTAQEQGATAQANWQAAEDATRASPRQVGYIMGLLKKRAASGEGGGFMAGPTTSEEVRKLTQSQARAYINSLKGDY